MIRFNVATYFLMFISVNCSFAVMTCG